MTAYEKAQMEVIKALLDFIQVSFLLDSSTGVVAHPPIPQDGPDFSFCHNL